MISQPGIYNIPIAEYLSDPCPAPSFSSSCGKLALQLSPQHAWLAHPRLGGNAQTPNPAMDFGSVVHELALGNGAQFLVIDAEDFRTKAARELRDDAIAQGLIPIKQADLKRAKAVADAIRNTLHNVFSIGVAEQTLIWQDGNIWCRARPDWMIMDEDMVFDLKITKVDMSPLENSLNRHVFSYWYDLTVAHYTDGYRSLTGRELEYRFLFVEPHPPFSIRQIKLSGQGLEMGERKLRAARELWKRCMARDEWPGMESRLELIDPEPWAAAGWLLDGEGRPITDYEAAIALAAQAPLEDEK